MSEKTTDPTMIERCRCIDIIENHLKGHRISAASDSLSRADKALHWAAMAALETVHERISKP